jgi:hypothetical protein
MKISPGNGLAFRIGKGLNRCGRRGRAPDGVHPIMWGAFRQAPEFAAVGVENSESAPRATPMKDVI